ncbi:MauE/DoxX family redox-associated membrane protein [Chitinophaga defluvii]|uniref:MauE/DoxX family redox-associated membrane protein n=1 Tax=Chitinophaga defluvii TaxID=3163343 RepID=A0ABV2TAQ8_9BACT
MKRRAIIEIICSLLAILFVYTGLTKLFNYSEFRFQLGRSPFVQPIAGLISDTLPAFELIVVLLLTIRYTRLVGLYASFFLMVLFTGYIWAMLHYSYYVPCSCGGILEELTWNDHLLLNSAYTVLSFIGIVLQAKENSVRSEVGVNVNTTTYGTNSLLQ